MPENSSACPDENINNLASFFNEQVFKVYSYSVRHINASDNSSVSGSFLICPQGLFNFDIFRLGGKSSYDTVEIFRPYSSKNMSCFSNVTCEMTSILPIARVLGFSILNSQESLFYSNRCLFLPYTPKKRIHRPVVDNLFYADD